MINLLAILADLYIPLLIITWLFYLYQQESNRGGEIKVLLLSLVLVYSLMLLDNYFNIWPAWGLDYSTHSAVALIFVVNLTGRNRILKLLAPLSLFAYCALMRFLNYHSFVDTLSTLLVLLPALIYWQKRLKINTGLWKEWFNNRF
ncbi:MAG: hypothetical protein ACJAZP_003240 [Psychromonas sp.]|jgi:hypothetical protein|uniref:hypothetical protein n=1 Tax=Psychromonas sp. TaxID=1884585 RepID=UPI0039E5C531